MKRKSIIIVVCSLFTFFTLMSFGSTIKSFIYKSLGYGTVLSTDGVASKVSFYTLKFKTIDGKEIDFSQYKGKRLLLVNTASECGFTHQYEGLEKLHEQYGDKLTILGFPANNFGGQEPGDNGKIAAFCQKNFGVTFQLFEKSEVIGTSQNTVYQWLSNKDMNGWNTQVPKWNFCKYLVNENGELIKYLGSSVEPMDNQIIEFATK